MKSISKRNKSSVYHNEVKISRIKLVNEKTSSNEKMQGIDPGKLEKISVPPNLSFRMLYTLILTLTKLKYFNKMRAKNSLSSFFRYVKNIFLSCSPYYLAVEISDIVCKLVVNWRYLSSLLMISRCLLIFRLILLKPKLIRWNKYSSNWTKKSG